MFIQTAMLYTSSSGERMLRVHNLKLTTTESIKSIYENANCEAVVNILAKKAIKRMILNDNPENGGGFLESTCKSIVQQCFQI